MTYLDLVNDVLIRLREDTVDAIGGSAQQELDDPVATMVKQFVNDAKRLVEDAHTWNGLREEWTFTTVPGTAVYPLTNAREYAIIEDIYSVNGNELDEAPLSKIRRDALRQGQNTPRYYAVDGADTSGDVQLRLSPTPNVAVEYVTYGYQRTPDLQTDTDMLKVPSKPVVYYALGLAARERGEVGGQTSTDIFAMAKAYLNDAIALDASLNSLDDIWFTI